MNKNMYFSGKCSESKTREKKEKEQATSIKKNKRLLIGRKKTKKEAGKKSIGTTRIRRFQIITRIRNINTGTFGGSHVRRGDSSNSLRRNKAMRRNRNGRNGGRRQRILLRAGRGVSRNRLRTGKGGRLRGREVNLWNWQKLLLLLDSMKR